jgi:hypothetical protein
MTKTSVKFLDMLCIGIKKYRKVFRNSNAVADNPNIFEVILGQSA